MHNESCTLLTARAVAEVRQDQSEKQKNIKGREKLRNSQKYHAIALLFQKNLDFDMVHSGQVH